MAPHVKAPGTMQDRHPLHPIYAHLCRTSTPLAVAEIAGVSMASSVLICWAIMAVLLPNVGIADWIWPALVIPLIMASATGAVYVSLVKQLETARARLSQAATTDQLTGIGNRRRFLERAAHELETARPTRPVSVLMLDIDHFKAINDTYGHAVGDEVLVLVARHCQEQLPEGDMLCRWGGEEFIALLPDRTAPEAHAISEHLRLSFEALSDPDDLWPVTVSIGLATGTAATPIDDLIRQADDHLYGAKQSGRNMTMAAAE